MEVVDYLQFVKTANSYRERLLVKQIERVRAENDELRREIILKEQLIRELRSELSAWYRFREGLRRSASEIWRNEGDDDDA